MRSTLRLFVLLTFAFPTFAEGSHALPLLSLSQRNQDGSTLSAGATTRTTTVQISAYSNSLTYGGGSYTMDIEVRKTIEGFMGVATHVSGANMNKGGTEQYPWTSVGPLLPGTYKWQARERTASGSSAWTTFNGGLSAFTVSNPSGLSVSPTSYDFGNQPVGGTSSAAVFTVSSTGTGTLNISSISTTGPFQVSGILVPRQVVSGGSVMFNVNFTPTGAGAASGTLTITSDAPGSSTIINLRGTGTTPRIAVMPMSIDFGQRPVGSPGNTAVTLTNTGAAPLAVSAITLDRVPPPFTLMGVTLPLLIPAGSMSSFQVVFNPTQPVVETATLTIESDDPASPMTMLSVRGEGISLGLNGLPNPVAFGRVSIGSGRTERVTLSNNTPIPVTVRSFTISGPSSLEFDISTSPIPGSIVVSMASLVFQIPFSPSGHGAHSATVTVVSDAPNSPLTIELSGEGVGPRLTVTPNPLDVGRANVGASSLSLLRLRNDGEMPLRVTSVSFSGGHGADFSVLAVFPLDIAPGNEVSVAIAFQPGSLGVRNARMTLTSDDPLASTKDVDLAGSGTSPVIEVAPMRVDFGDVGVGSASLPEEVTVSNTGDGLLTVRAIGVAGADASEFRFSLPALPVVVQPGASRTMSPLFVPGRVGSASAKMVLDTDDRAAPHVEIPLDGNGVSGRVMITPPLLDFGSQIVGRSSTEKRIDITNTGGATMTLATLAIAGGGASAFVLASPMLPVVVAPGASQSIAVRYAPDVVGMSSARIEVGTDDPSTPTGIVLLRGVGISTTIAVSPMRLDFGSLRAPGRGTLQALTIENIGEVPFELLDAVVTGEGANAFSIERAAGVLVPGAKRAVQVGFMPDLPGVKRAAALFSVSGGTLPSVSVELLGRGTYGVITAYPDEVSFGRASLGSRVPRTVRLTNISENAVTISSALSSSDVFLPTISESLVGPGGTAILAIDFLPTVAGRTSSKISIFLGGAVEAEVVIPVEGEGFVLPSPGEVRLTSGGCEVGRGVPLREIFFKLFFVGFFFVLFVRLIKNRKIS